MSALLLSALLMAPAQPGPLKLTNVRSTYGELGGTRPEAKLLPGDVLYVAFDIEGITIAADGRAQYRMAMDVTDKNGKAMFKQDPADKIDDYPLGGTKVPARAYVLIGLDMEPGVYTLKLTVTDTASRQAESFEKKFEVLKKDFGIVDTYLSVDLQGQTQAPTTCIVGQPLFLQFNIVGFERDKDEAKKDPKQGFQPNVSIEFSPVDETNRPTLGKPTQHLQNNTSQLKLEPADQIINLRFGLPMTRPGKFVAKLKATDLNANKTATFELPFVVIPPAN
jgi:hypothetical protein